MILSSLLRDRFVDLLDRDGRELPIICAVTTEKSADMATLTTNGHGRKAFLPFHVSGELINKALIPRSWRRLQPDSALRGWFRARCGGGGTRLRRIGMVAVARK